MKEIKFNMFELKLTNEQENEIKNTGKLEGIDLSPCIIDSKAPILDNIAWGRLFAMPKVEDMTYRQIMLKCVSKLFCDLTNGLDRCQKVDSDEDFERLQKGEGITVDDIHIEYRHFLADLGCIVQYAMNSSSFKNGEFYAFDSLEIINKLDTLIAFCNFRISKEEFIINKKEPSFEAITAKMINFNSVPIYEGIKVGASIDVILDKIEDKEIDYHARFFYIKENDVVKFYTYNDLK